MPRRTADTAHQETVRYCHTHSRFSLLCCRSPMHVPMCAGTWNEVFVSINDKSMYLWRAVDCEGEGLDVLVQLHRNKHVALKLMRKLLKSQHYCPTVIVADKLPSYGATHHRRTDEQ